jgi:hypothetical protein
MDLKFVEAAGKIAGIGGIALAVLFLLFRTVLKTEGLLARMNQSQTYKTVRSLLYLTSLVTALAVCAWLRGETSESADPDGRSLEEAEVVNQWENIVPLRADFTDIQVYDEKAREKARDKVCDLAPKYAQAMLAIDDRRLNITHQITKYEYAGYALTIAGAAELNSKRKIEYAERALTVLDKGLSLANEAAMHESQDAFHKQAAEFVRSDNAVPRMKYTRAMALAVSGSLNPSAGTRDEVLHLLSDVPDWYKRSNPPESTAAFNWIWE